MRSSPLLTLRWRLALLPGAMALVFALVGMLGVDWTLRRQAEAAAQATAVRAANALSVAVERSLDRRVADLEMLAEHFADERLDDVPALRARLTALQRRSGGYAWIGLIDLQGRVIGGTGGVLEGQDIHDRPVFAQGREGLFVGDLHPAVVLAPYLPSSGGKLPVLADFGVPVRDGQGRVRAVLVAHVFWNWFEQLRDEVQGDVAAGSALHATVRSPAGMVLRGDDSLRWPSLDGLPQTARQEPPRLLRLPGGEGGTGDDGWLVTVKTLAPRTAASVLGWQVVVVQSLRETLAPARSNLRPMLGWTLASVLAFGALGLVLSRRLSQPYHLALERAARQLDAGAPVDSLRGGNAVLDTMVEQLHGLHPAAGGSGPLTGQDVLAQLVRDADRLQLLVESLPSPVFLVSREGRVLYWNRACESIFGWAAAEALDHPLDDLLRAVREDGPGWKARLDTACAQAEPVDFVRDVAGCDDLRVTAEWRLVALRDRVGKLLGVLGQARDLTAERRATREARSLAQRFSALIEAASDYAFVLLDSEGRISGWNAGATRLIGHEAEAVAGRHYSELFPEEERLTGLPALLLQRARREGRTEHEGRRLRANGSLFWADVLIYALPDGGFAKITRDLSQRRRAELQLAQERQTLAAVIDGASDAIISTDGQGRITLFNPAAERIFQRPAAEMLGGGLEALLPPGRRHGHQQDLAGFASSLVSRRAMGVGQVEGVRADGQPLLLEASISQALVGEGQLLTAILRDVTDRVKAEQALRRYQEDLSALARQLMDQDTRTTRRLAQALHDQLGQTLAALRLSWDALQRTEPRLAAGPGDELSRHIGGLIEHAVREVRQVLVDLRPPLLEEQGLLAALENEFYRGPVATRPGAPDVLVEAEDGLDSLRWAVEVEQAVFMIAREAVANALRHANATLVRVVVGGDAQRLSLQVIDDGSGLVIEEGALLPSRPGHLGMVGMRERAAAIGAYFKVGLTPEGGTIVALHWSQQGPDEPTLPR